jgi:hypothetical protein
MKIITRRSPRAVQAELRNAGHPADAGAQKKYKGKDPKKLQSETMALTAPHVNPHCLIPMLVQFPIWIALYQVIRVSLGDTPESLVTLSGRLYPIPFVHQAVPLNNGLLYWNLGQSDTSYVLPFIVAASMYVQQKLITPTPTGATTAQSQQPADGPDDDVDDAKMFASGLPCRLTRPYRHSNVAGIVLQHFTWWKFQWASLLVKLACRRHGAAKKIERANCAGAAAADVQVDEGGEATLSRPQNVRRNKHGRRRGKR